MPYQNLDAGILLAIGMWLLALFVFATMLLAVIVQLISENRSKTQQRQKRASRPIRKYPSPSGEKIPAEEP